MQLVSRRAAFRGAVLVSTSIVSLALLGNHAYAQSSDVNDRGPQSREVPEPRKDNIVRVRNAAEEERMRRYIDARIDRASVMHEFRTQDGEWVDCVDVNRQPSLKHPALRGHRVEMVSVDPVPSGASAGAGPIVGESPSEVPGKAPCPIGSIPIVRMTLDKLKTFETLEDVFRKIPSHLRDARSGDVPPVRGATNRHQYATAIQTVNNWGIEATFNHWRPFIEAQNEEFSLAQLWISRATTSGFQTIEAGWQVYPDKYKSASEKLFIYWTADNYNATGCYNLDCPGFVQTNNQIIIGGGWPSTSVTDGTQKTFTLRVSKSSATGNWQLRYITSATDVVIGYWPRDLFRCNSSGICSTLPSLGDQADELEIGGEIVNANSTRHTRTDMGSGGWPSEGFGKAAYIRNIRGISTSFSWMTLGLGQSNVTDGDCYDKTNSANSSWGTYMYFGGSGYNTNCE